MKIGVRSHDFGRMNEEILAKIIKNAGFQSVQLAITKAIEGINKFEDIRSENIISIRNAFCNADLEIKVLGCYIEPSLENKEDRMRHVGNFISGINHASELGVKIIGTETTNFSIDEKYREAAYLRLKDSVLRMVEEAEKKNITIGIEPVAEHTLNTSRLTRRLLDEVKSDRLKIILDPVNMLLPTNFLNQEKIFEEFFSLLGDEIVVIHMKDVEMINGEKVWRNIGKGIVNYNYIFNWLKANKPDIHLLREHVKMDSYNEDIKAIKSLIY